MLLSPISPVAHPSHYNIFTHTHTHTHTGTYLVVVSVRDGVGLDSRLLHLKQDPDGQDGLAVLPAQLHQHPVAHLEPGTGQEEEEEEEFIWCFFWSLKDALQRKTKYRKIPNKNKVLNSQVWYLVWVGSGVMSFLQEVSFKLTFECGY